MMNNICEKRSTVKAKGVQGTTKFDRERKKLEWNMQEKEKSRKGGSSQRGKGALMLVMKIKILSWNVRGANDTSKRKLIKMFLKTQKAGVVCI